MSKPRYPFVAIFWEQVEHGKFKATHKICLSKQREIISQEKIFSIISPVVSVNDYEEVFHLVPQNMGDQMIADAFDLNCSAYVTYRDEYEHLPRMKDFDFPLNDS